jgi:anaerobic carbon-monoxide dehydrogenase iron sulfur subunit
MRIKADKTKCTGCLLCEITCSLLHHGQVQREASAIRVQLNDLEHGLHQPVVCRQCKKMPCLSSEGEEADEKRRNSFFWEGNRQIKDNCAFNALFVFGEKLIHCNLCEGDPECIKSCPTGALTLSCGEELSQHRIQKVSSNSMSSLTP